MRKKEKKKREWESSTGFIGGAGPNEQYTDDDLIQINVLINERQVFLVMVYEYTEKQIEDVKILIANLSEKGFSNEAICRWCFMHGIKFKVITLVARWRTWEILYYLHLRHYVNKLEKQYANKE